MQKKKEARKQRQLLRGGWVSHVDLVCFHCSRLQKFCCQGLHYFLYFCFLQLSCLCVEPRFPLYDLDILSKKEFY